jgi:hypothetical protein
MARRRGVPGLSFSLKRAVGITAAKQKFAKATGVPTTKAGRQRKAGAAVGCSVMLAMPLAGLLAATAFIIWN